MKRSTKQRLVQGVLYGVLVIIVVVLALLADWQAVRENFFDAEVARGLWPEIVTVGARNTILYTVIAFVGGLLLAVVLALMKLSPAAPYRWLATAYIEFFRGLPALLVIIISGFAIPIAFGWRPPGGLVGAGLAALIVVSSAYMAETLRAGIQAVPKGQTEAARSLGMSGGRTTLSIVLPQALRIVIPPLTNEFVLLIKDTSLLAVIGVAASQRELTTFARDENSLTANSTPLMVAALLYLVITLPLTQLVAALERRQQRAR
ncbi:MAG: ABC transporter, permease protein (cluster 3, basic aa/glutamine/opines) [uncultured Nocardioidaceae bacterium]|uniref:ABC transporter, permease protein (Cluster 3, basic aa/glutamine/opines) n=1 Tax=uncultured Nocardioidaceae bacterium TaxID=253824 RepID=A0A6J4M987_9ACTN|nr:MAG: ABC transporter, permease protein (cluster 3, basic aa/glutamine/opines) [uncultured Nocardioidaceae bacterium]